MIGNSMEPTIKDGQVIVAKSIDDIANLQRGDIILINREENALIRRLIALPGETIEINQGTILINGAVYNEPYEVIPATYLQEPLQLGKDEYYVLGDNREDSIDSHSFGPITGEMILKRVTP
jgi:signal peptidase I